LLAGIYDVEQAYALSDGSTGSKTNPNFINVIVGIDTPTKNDFKIYPNPTNGIINITGKPLFERVGVIDMTGREVIRQESLGQNTQIDLGSLPSGVYFVRLMVDGAFITSKVVKR
jgi:hypothetical protein